PIPLLVAHLDGHVEDRFVLLSGHVDSWHHGAMDNAAANATMLEVARLLGGRRDRLRRGLRVAFWSGHSHGRYAGSAWYADHAWSELHRRCVLHLNADSTGARGATDYSTLHATEDAQLFAEAVVRDLTGQSARGRRISRAGDQSFWGAGVPSAFMSLSGIPRPATAPSRTVARRARRRARHGARPSRRDDAGRGRPRAGQPRAREALADPGAARVHDGRSFPARPRPAAGAPRRAPGRARPRAARAPRRRLQV